MLQRWRLGFAVLFCFVAVPAADFAAASGDGPSDEDLKTWVKQLDSDSYQERESATEKLKKAGRRSIAPLMTGAIGKSPEMTSRALDILKFHYRHGDQAAQAEAGTALKKLAKSDDPLISRRAADALKQAAPQQQPNIQGRFPIPVMPIQILPMPNNGMNNWEKKIVVKDDDQQISITENNNGISIEVVTTKDGKQETKKYQAKNLKQLKKKHPEAAKLYEKHAGKNAKNMQIAFGFGGPGEVLEDNAAKLNEIRDELKKSLENLRNVQKDGEAELKKAQEQLEAARRKIAELRKKWLDQDQDEQDEDKEDNNEAK